jgi:hypothetical protein
MKLTEAGILILDGMTKYAGAGEMAIINAHLKRLPDDDRLAIDQAIGDYSVAVMESAFLAGLKAGANPLALLVDA